MTDAEAAAAAGVEIPDRPSVYRLTDVVKVREKGGARFELRVPSLDVRRGEFVAVVGPSGCGKSTLLDLLGLVLKPTRAGSFAIRAGDAWLDVAAMNERRLAEVRRAHIGYVLQTGGLLPFLTVRKNILLPCRLSGRGGGPEAEALAERLGIADQLGKKPQHLSGGQRQRVAIARALAHKPPLVLADEPTAAVDRPTALEIHRTFKELTAELGVTLIMVTHDVSLAKGAADRFFAFRIERKSPEHTVSTVLEARPRGEGGDG